MTTTTPAAVPRNPFATRHTRPGCLAPRNPAGEALDVAALATHARHLRAAAIVGPHGAGKTNLMHALARHLGGTGLLGGTIRVRSRRDGIAVLRAVLRARPRTTVCVDGWEPLGRAGALSVRWLAAVRRVGLVVTCHRSAGMPTLVRCATTPALLARLVADLPGHGGLIGATDVHEAFAARRGDVREALYDLYDRFERRARGA